MGWWGLRSPASSNNAWDEEDKPKPKKPAAPPKNVKMTEEQVAAMQKRCLGTRKALAACRRANEGGDIMVCSNLEMSLVSCLGQTAAVPQADEHRRCYTSLYKTGVFRGVGHCIPQETALKEALRKLKLYPV